MKTIWIATAALLVGLSPLFAADGDLLATEPVALDYEGLLEGLDEEGRQGLRATLDELAGTVELSRITYESEGLRVRGYLALPRTGKKLPCVIFNRGGNREFGAMVFEGGDHGLSEFRDEVDAAVGAWLDRDVRDGERWPSLEPHGR